MFTGIIESTGTLIEKRPTGSNLDLCFESSISSGLGVDQSVSHNGVCLTVTRVSENSHWVTAVQETLQRSNLGLMDEGDVVNLERCMKADGRFDGHIVQGHVDITGKVEQILEKDGSWLFSFSFKDSSQLIVEKGSICVNGVSLTCFEVSDNSFHVAIIPYTYDNTNFKELKTGDSVNLEFDIIGKYLQRVLRTRGL